MKTWFEELFGFKEEDYEYDEVRNRFRLEDDDCVLVSLVNGRRFNIGKFEIPSLEELDERIQKLTAPIIPDDKLSFEHISGDAKALHLDPDNMNSVFQAASQFNCLEMIHPKVTPDHGITDYIRDHTQGPACAMSCPAGTLYRNYFANTFGQGGEQGKQLDCLYDTGRIFGNEKNCYWQMTNGYALPKSKDSIKKIKEKIMNGEVDTNEVRKKVKVGVNWNTEVTNKSHCVTQVYCSALPIGYSNVENPTDFEPFARIVLEAAYDATLAIAAILSQQHQRRIRVFLTKIGGGVFKNDHKWIKDAIHRALVKYYEFPLDIYLVHHGSIDKLYDIPPF